VLDRRLVQIPVVVLAPDGRVTTGWRQETRVDEREEEMEPPTAGGGGQEPGGGITPPAEEEAAAERPVGGGAPLEILNGE